MSTEPIAMLTATRTNMGNFQLHFRMRFQATFQDDGIGTVESRRGTVIAWLNAGSGGNTIDS